MSEWARVDTASTPDGTELTLHRRGDEWVIRANGRDLMSNLMHTSEEEMARRVRPTATRGARVLIGGLGMGYTLRAALDVLPPGCRCTVAELSAAVVNWNRGPLADLAGRPLEDPRVDVAMGDVTRTLWSGQGAWDVVLLDVDNGPGAFTQVENGALYTMAGLQRTRLSLRRGGAMAVWSAFDDPGFTQRMQRAGFVTERITVRARGSAGGPRHYIYVGRLPTGGARTAGGVAAPRRAE